LIIVTTVTAIIWFILSLYINRSVQRAHIKRRQLITLLFTEKIIKYSKNSAFKIDLSINLSTDNTRGYRQKYSELKLTIFIKPENQTNILQHNSEVQQSNKCNSRLLKS
jgi:hypothetical protein